MSCLFENRSADDPSVRKKVRARRRYDGRTVAPKECSAKRPLGIPTVTDRITQEV